LLLSSHCLTFASDPKNDEMAVVNAENDKTETAKICPGNVSVLNSAGIFQI
jgi:hypothetical protein